MKTLLAFATLVILDTGTAQAATCPNFTGNYRLDSKDLGTTLVIAQSGCELIHMTWFADGVKGAEYIREIDGQAHQISDVAGYQVVETWSWNNGELESIQETKSIGTIPGTKLDEAIDSIYSLDNKGNLTAFTGILEDGVPAEETTGSYIRVP